MVDFRIYIFVAKHIFLSLHKMAVSVGSYMDIVDV